MAFPAAKGMVDAYPADRAAFSHIKHALAGAARRYGFVQADPPIVETLRLLTAKSGDDVKDQLFLLEKKGSEELALRFDLTVPMTRMFVARQRELQKPIKWFSTGKAWRYEAPQKGRLREFYQLSVEQFGASTAAADAEIINLLIDSLRALGLTKDDFFVRMNSRKLLEALVKDIAPKADFEAVVRVIDKKHKISDEEFRIELEKCKLTKTQVGAIDRITAYKGHPKKTLQALMAKEKISKAAQEGIAELSGIIADLPEDFVELDLSIARGLAYYTGIVFEAFDRLGKFRALAGGGRYDNLVKLLGGEDTPACGFGIGYTTLQLLLEDRGKLPVPSIGPDYYIAPVNDAVAPKAREIATKLRANHSVDIDLVGRKLGKQFEYASSIGAKKIVIVGEKDLADKKVTVRDLKSGKEEKVALKDLK